MIAWMAWEKINAEQANSDLRDKFKNGGIHNILPYA